MSTTTSDEHAERFTLLRPLLFTIVYEILGSAAESDVVLAESAICGGLATTTSPSGARRQVVYRAQHVTRHGAQAIRTAPAATTEVTEQFMTAPPLLDMEGLLTMLAPDATWTTDSGGKVKAIRRPVVGAKKVATLIVSFFRIAPQRVPDVRFEMANYNNAPAVVIYSGDRVEGMFLVEVIDGKITNFYAMANPDKLAGIAAPHAISR